MDGVAYNDGSRGFVRSGNRFRVGDGVESTCGAGAVRVPMEGPPGEVVCVPEKLFERSKMEVVVPPLFAAMVVAGSACFVKAVGLWEDAEER
ncbi:hypothetical protein DsansV1_C17g0147471 [Dioscorea sansibarensis]